MSNNDTTTIEWGNQSSDSKTLFSDSASFRCAAVLNGALTSATHSPSTLSLANRSIAVLHEFKPETNNDVGRVGGDRPLHVAARADDTAVSRSRYIRRCLNATDNASLLDSSPTAGVGRVARATRRRSRRHQRRRSVARYSSRSLLLCDLLVAHRVARFDNESLRDSLRQYYRSGQGLEQISGAVLSTKVYERIRAILSGEAPDLAALAASDDEEE